MRWYLVAKQSDSQPQPEIRLGRWTEAAFRNNQRHGWRYIGSWPLRPTEVRVREVIFNWKEAQSG